MGRKVNQKETIYRDPCELAKCCLDNHEYEYMLGMFCCTVDHRLRVLLLESLRMEDIMKPFDVSSWLIRSSWSF